MTWILVCGLGLTIACGAEHPVRPSPTAPTSPIPPTQPTTYTLSGNVRDEGGAPLQGARVTVGYDPRRAGFGSAETDARGQYRVTGLLRGESRYGVSKPGYIFISGTVSIGEETVKDFMMRPGVVIGGRIDENGVGPLGDVTITVASGPNAGTQTKSTSWGSYSLPPIAPGEVLLRSAKDGYDSVDRTIHALVDNHLVNFTLKWAYGTCLTSVAPVLVDRFTSAGGTVQVAVSANPDRTWTSTTDTPWIEMLTGTGRGGGTARLRVLPHPAGALEARSGA